MRKNKIGIRRKACEVAQQVKVPAMRPEDLSLIPGTHIEKERIDSDSVSSDLHSHEVVHK